MSQQNEDTRELLPVDGKKSAVAHSPALGKSFGYTLPSDQKARAEYLRCFALGWAQFHGDRDEL
jgi:hypothetical protein